MQKIEDFFSALPSGGKHDAKDCGPTCLRMISSFYGKKISVELLREMTHVSRTGVSMLGISEAAEKIGFRTIGARLTFSKVENVPLPCIVYRNQRLFVVVYKIERKNNKKYVYVASDLYLHIWGRLPRVDLYIL